MSNLFKKQRRDFLSEMLHQYGTVAWHVEVNSHYDDGRSPHIDSELRITDCNKVVTLDFDIYSGSEEKAFQYLDKIGKLIESLKDFQSTLEKQVGVIYGSKEV